MSQHPSYYSCPHCEAQLETQLLHLLARLERHNGKASTTALAVALHLSRWQAWRYLKQLEAEGKVQRVGQRGGWKQIA